MKCPKCHYLSFEPEPRCRNCGYDLELSADDLRIGAEPVGADEPLADLALRGPAIETPELDESGLPAPRARPTQPARPATRTSQPAPTTELPLFVTGMSVSAGDEDDPLVTLPATPAPPVAVQRRAPDSGRHRPSARTASVPSASAASASAPAASAPAASVPSAGRTGVQDGDTGDTRRLGTFGRDLLQDLERLDRRAAQPDGPGRRFDPRPDAVVPAGTRLAAAAIDAGFLGTIGVVVFWLTLRWCGLTLGQAASLPAIPLAAFVLLVATGYLLMFTAALAAETIGKMACGIRVTDAFDDGTPAGPVTARQACLRALLTVPSVLALGAGFLPALVGEGRAFHDRLTQTRVVRA